MLKPSIWTGKNGAVVDGLCGNSSLDFNHERVAEHSITGYVQQPPKLPLHNLTEWIVCSIAGVKYSHRCEEQHEEADDLTINCKAAAEWWTRCFELSTYTSTNHLVYIGTVSSMSSFSTHDRCHLMWQDPFTQCHVHINPEPFISACVNNLCRYPALDGLKCHLMEAYVRACHDQSNVSIDGWRSMAKCGKDMFSHNMRSRSVQNSC